MEHWKYNYDYNEMNKIMEFNNWYEIIDILLN